MLVRLIAMVLLFSFGFSVVGECCIAEAGHHEDESSCSQEDRTNETYKSYTTYTSHDSHQEDHATCEDHCAACLHTVLTPSQQEPVSITISRYEYPPLAIERIHSSPSAIDRPPCWIA
jgi:hypothetical protein